MELPEFFMLTGTVLVLFFLLLRVGKILASFGTRFMSDKLQYSSFWLRRKRF